MGASHVSAVYANWSHLPDQAFRLLVYMALVPKDDNPRPIFWKGRDAMAEIGLGKVSEKTDDAAHQSVKRAVRVLVGAGALIPVRKGNKARRAEYLIVLTGPEGAPERPPVETDDADPDARTTGHSVTHVTGHSVTDNGSLSDQVTGHSVTDNGSLSDPPRNTGTQRNTRSAQEEHHSPTKVTSPRAREDDEQTTDGADDVMTPFEAADILRRAAEQDEIDVSALMKAAPEECNTKARRRIWAAQQIRKDAS